MGFPGKAGVGEVYVHKTRGWRFVILNKLPNNRVRVINRQNNQEFTMRDSFFYYIRNSYNYIPPIMENE